MSNFAMKSWLKNKKKLGFFLFLWFNIYNIFKSYFILNIFIQKIKSNYQNQRKKDKKQRRAQKVQNSTQ